MMRRVELRGARFVVGGRLRGGRADALTRELVEAGGVAAGPSATRLDFFVAGEGAGERAAAAKLRGVPLLSEAQALALLADGALEWEEAAAAGDETLDASVAELRGLFAQGPSAACWTRCLEIVEACAPERVEDLVRYVEPFIAAWDSAPMGAWAPPKKHALTEDMPSRWLKGLPEDELRVAPVSWTYAMMRGEHHLKHGLARCINLEGLKINGSLGIELLKSPYLTNVRALVLGSQNRLSAAFYNELRACELMRSVRQLWINTTADMLWEALGAPDHSFDSLSQVWIYHALPTSAGELPCFKGVPIKASERWIGRY